MAPIGALRRREAEPVDELGLLVGAQEEVDRRDSAGARPARSGSRTEQPVSTTRSAGLAALSFASWPCRPMTFCSAASRIAQVLMTTRSAVSNDGASAQPAASRRPAISSESLRFIWQPSVQTWKRGRAAASGRYSLDPLVGDRDRPATGHRAWRHDVQDGERASGRSVDHGWWIGLGGSVVSLREGLAPGRCADRIGIGGRHPESRVRLGVRLPVAMVVAAARGHESEPVRDGGHGRDGLAVEAAVVDLDPAQPDLAQLAQDRLAVRGVGGVGEDREPARRPDGADRVASARARSAARSPGRPRR